MDKYGVELLEKEAKAAGYDSIDEYLVYCEVLGIVKKMNVALDRAFLPDELMKYCEKTNEVVLEKIGK